VGDIYSKDGGVFGNVWDWRFTGTLHSITIAGKEGPTRSPTYSPTRSPSRSPSHSPTRSPSHSPTRSPTRSTPSLLPNPTRLSDGAKNDAKKGAPAKAACADDDAGVKAESGGKVTNCAEAAGMCKHGDYKATMEKLCPKACGLCIETCKDPFVSDPESWDCACHEIMVKRCKDSDEGFTGCYQRMLCASRRVCDSWKRQVCKGQVAMQADMQLDDAMTGKGLATGRLGWAPSPPPQAQGYAQGSPTVNPTEPPLADQGPTEHTCVDF